MLNGTRGFHLLNGIPLQARVTTALYKEKSGGFWGYLKHCQIPPKIYVWNLNKVKYHKFSFKKKKRKKNVTYM